MKIKHTIVVLLIILCNAAISDESRIDSLQNIVMQEKNDSLQQSALLSFALEIKDIFNEKAAEYADKAIKISQNAGNKEKMAHAFVVLGEIQASGNNFQQAIHSYKNALEYYIDLSEKHAGDTDNLRAMAQAYYGLGKVYQMMGEHETASLNYNKAETVFSKLQDINGQSQAQIAKGNSFRDQLKYEEALKAYFAALELQKSKPFSQEQAEIYRKIAFTHSLMGQTNKAIDYYNEYIRIENKLSKPERIARAYNEVGGFYIRLNQTNKALQYFNDALQIAMSINNNTEIEVASSNLSDIYAQMGNYKKAFDNHIIYSGAREFNSFKNKREELRILEMKNDLYRTESKNLFTEQLYKEEQLKNRNAFFVILILTSAFVIVLVLVFLLYRQNKKNKNVLRLLSEQNNEVQQKTEEIRMQNIRLEQINRDLNLSKQKAEEATNSKSLFLANMSHEIRTPMNGIIGMANEMKNTQLNNEQYEALNIITVSAENLLTIINEILDFSKIESGKLELESIQFDLYQEIKSLIALLSLKSREKNLELLSEIDPYVPRYLVGDPVRLKQIIINLVNNGLKFTEKGGVRVNVVVVDHISRTTIIRVEVIDTGIGITENEKQRLFHSFSQMDASFTRKYGGTGLGLAISKNLVQLMNGEIGVESEYGKGSKFYFTARFTDGVPPQGYIPRREPLKIYARIPELKKTRREFYPENQPVQKMEQKDTNKAEGLRILLIEDNLINQKVALSVLKKQGHSVEIAGNGKIGLEKYIEGSFQIILMDIMMPVMDGFEATKKIREYESENGHKHVRIVAMTANALKEDREKCLAAGMDDYISKPFKPKELAEKIRTI